MKLLKLFLGGVLFMSVKANAFSFNLDGEIIESDISEKIVDCGSYEIHLKNEHFPYKYEMQIPSTYQIEGFFGSFAIIEMSAVIHPVDTRILTPNELKNIQSLYPSDRVYLPASAVCKESIFIMSYWSGGNCKECEAFVQFEVIDGKPTNAQKVNYGDFNALK